MRFLRAQQAVLLGLKESWRVFDHEHQVLDAKVDFAVGLDRDLACLLRDQSGKLFFALVEKPRECLDFLVL